MALLVAVEVDDGGLPAAPAGILLVVRDADEAVRQATSSELPETRWQPSSAHCQRDVLAPVPVRGAREAAAGFWAAFVVRREETDVALAHSLPEPCGRRYPGAVERLLRGLDDTLT